LLFSNWQQEKVVEQAQPLLNDIRDAINETVILGARIRNRVLIMATAEAFDSLKISVPLGSTIPLFAGAVGKVFLAEDNPISAALRSTPPGCRITPPVPSRIRRLTGRSLTASGPKATPSTSKNTCRVSARSPSRCIIGAAFQRPCGLWGYRPT